MALQGTGGVHYYDALPATGAVGDVCVVTATNPGVYVCTAPNVWEGLLRGMGLSGITVRNTPPATPIAGDLWVDTDASSKQWKRWTGSAWEAIK